MMDNFTIEADIIDDRRLAISYRKIKKNVVYKIHKNTKQFILANTCKFW